ncbi:MAG: outer membrane protein assembly factor BamD [Burkholderiaceae bacterium]|nr:MAG: outer membrane protein assembly factor BamD [Burkholderiaceae bacterium]
MQTLAKLFLRPRLLPGAGLRALCLLVLAMGLTACGIFGGEKDETAGWSASKLYAEAQDEMKSGNWDKAVSLLEKLEARYPFGRYAQQAQIETAYAQYKNGEQALALAAADRFIKLHPNHPSLDYVYYLKGLINFNDRVSFFSWLASQDMAERDPKAAHDAFDSFKELAERFPESKYTPDAIARMKYLVNALAASDVHVARYYYKRGAYLAAANRAQSAIAQYQQAPAIEEALYILVKSYDALGMTDLRDDANRVLVQNFPNSNFVTGKKASDATPWWNFWSGMFK